MKIKKPKRTPIKINFGSSHDIWPGWINIDNSLRHIIITKIPFLPTLLYKIGILKEGMFRAHQEGQFKKVVYGDARKRLKFKKESVDVIYSAHMLEHLYFVEAMKFLKECHRILKKDGLIRIVVPNFETEIKKYTDSIQKNKNEKPAQTFCNLLYASSRSSQQHGHHWMYDQYSLSLFLKKAGFSDVKVVSFMNGECPDIEKNETRDGLFVEAKKEF